jgi:hypothetical protein
MSTITHKQIRNTIVSFGAVILAACSGDKSNPSSEETNSGDTIPIPSTGIIPTTTTEPTMSETGGRIPCNGTDAPNCYCWAEYTGAYIDYEFTCHEECVADFQSPNSNWTGAVCLNHYSCCTKSARCTELGHCIPPVDMETSWTTSDTSMSSSNTGNSETSSSETGLSGTSGSGTDGTETDTGSSGGP